MSKFELFLPGIPLGKQRTREIIRGRGANAYIHKYTPEQTVNWESYVKVLFTQKYPEWIPYKPGIPLFFLIKAQYAIPKSASAKLQEAMVTKAILPTKKPDNDNIEKITWDALSNIAYADDCQVVFNITTKVFSEQPGVFVSCGEYDPLDWIYLPTNFL
jgi:Holliday junction resolvase RusA-like endonuclease